MEKFAVIVGGGNGSRMGSTIPKQFLLLQGQPLLLRTLNIFLEAYDDLKLILVLPQIFLENGSGIIEQSVAPARVQIITGGDTRFHSVLNGLREVPEHAIVFVHDAVRCLVTTDLIHRCYRQTIEKGSAIPAVAAVDSLRFVDGDHHHVINRQQVRSIQTPQTFLAGDLLKAFRQQYSESFTDEATVMEAAGMAVHLIEGEITNIKITTPVDLLLADTILAGNASR